MSDVSEGGTKPTNGKKRSSGKGKEGAKAATAEGRMSLMEHLTELRTRIIRSVVAIAIGINVAIGSIFTQRIP